MGAQTVEAKPRTKTQYLVLTQTITPDGTVWTPIAGTFEGNTDVDAIRAAAAKLELEDGTFVAIPSRSFRPRTIAVQVRRSVSIG